MTKSLKILITVLVIGVAISLFFSVFSPNKVTTVVKEQLGAVVGPEILQDHLCFNGICHWYYEQNFAQATNTPCHFESPTATSTLVFAMADFKEATSTGFFLQWGKGAADTYATTTALNSEIEIFADMNEANDNPGIATFMASTTEQGKDLESVFKPRETLNLKWAFEHTDDGELASVDSLTGVCKAEFITVD